MKKLAYLRRSGERDADDDMSARLEQPITGVEPVRGDGRWTVPAGHNFLLGDNRHASADSRAFGAIPASHIVGKVVGKVVLIS